MSRNEIIKNLKNLQIEIRDYAEYLEKLTYHPYSKVKNFASQLQSIIENIENHE